MKQSKKVFIIAEAGVNHNGKLSIAKRMIDVAKDAGADAIKFQSFKTENIITRYAPKAGYQKNRSNKNESQFSMLKKLELSQDIYNSLYNYCRRKNIVFLSSPFDIESVDFLDKLGLKILKIPSGEITNFPYLKKIGSLKKQIIISTGMADLREIKNTLDIIIKAGTPKNNVTILHCNTEYPTPAKNANLLAMLKIRDSLRIKIGYSDHTEGNEVSIAAVALGARVIEKHFTLNKNMPGPDHKASLEPHELKTMIRSIRNIEKALGKKSKKPSLAEIRNKTTVRKSIVAAQNIKKGEIFSKKNITTKRPAKGISPMCWNDVIGKVAKKHLKKDELISL